MDYRSAKSECLEFLVYDHIHDDEGVVLLLEGQHVCIDAEC